MSIKQRCPLLIFYWTCKYLTEINKQKNVHTVHTANMLCLQINVFTEDTEIQASWFFMRHPVHVAHIFSNGNQLIFKEVALLINCYY